MLVDLFELFVYLFILHCFRFPQASLVQRGGMPLPHCDVRCILNTAAFIIHLDTLLDCHYIAMEKNWCITWEEILCTLKNGDEINQIHPDEKSNVSKSSLCRQVHCVEKFIVSEISLFKKKFIVSKSLMCRKV